MPQLWLPTKYIIKEPTTQREMILIIPGAEHMDGSQLKEILHWQQEKTEAELKAKGPKPVAKMSRKEVGQVLNEYLKYIRARQADPGHKQVF